MVRGSQGRRAAGVARRRGSEQVQSMGEALRRSSGLGRGRWRRAAVAAVLCVLLPFARANGQEQAVEVTRGRLTFLAFAGDTALAHRLADRALAVDSFPGLPRPIKRVIVQIAPDGARFREWIGANAPEWGAAFAVPAEQRVYMQGRGAPSSAGDPVQVLRHELAHLALHEALGELPPRWFDEGYASVSAGEWDRDAVLAANVGLALRGYRSLASVDSGFALGSGRANESYALAHRAVAELASLDRERGLTLFFRYWKESQSLEVAMRQAYGLTLNAYETLWRERTRRRYGGLALVTDISLAAAIMLVLVAPFYVARRRRDRERLASMRAAEAEAERIERQEALRILLESLDDRAAD